jgi:DNA repair exonuclease SbcCD ATPase subunit
MHILGMEIENFMRVRMVNLTFTGKGVVQFTGKNGQGKTSALDSVEAALLGAKGIPELPVRKGASQAKIILKLGKNGTREYLLTRTINKNGTHTLKLENAKGTIVASPQRVIDDLVGLLTFDPMEFMNMSAAEQVETLRRASKIDIDIDAMNAANARDYEARTILNREIKRLEVEVSGLPEQPGLPAEKLDEAAVLAKLNSASAENAKAQEAFKAKQVLGVALAVARRGVAQMDDRIEGKRAEVAALERQLAQARDTLRALEEEYLPAEKTKLEAAELAYNSADDGTPIDVSALTEELQRVQLTNREIDKRTRRQALAAQLKAKGDEAKHLTCAMEDREEAKVRALQSAPMPVPGLMFDDKTVTFNGIPIVQLGDAEKIRISATIGMSLNPELRILRFPHGEMLDEDGLKELAKMAKEHDFQFLMARVDSSGKVGIVMEDGMAHEAPEDSLMEDARLLDGGKS